MCIINLQSDRIGSFFEKQILKCYKYLFPTQIYKIYIGEHYKNRLPKTIVLLLNINTQKDVVNEILKQAKFINNFCNVYPKSVEKTFVSINELAVRITFKFSRLSLAKAKANASLLQTILLLAGVK